MAISATRCTMPVFILFICRPFDSWPHRRRARSGRWADRHGPDAPPLRPAPPSQPSQRKSCSASASLKLLSGIRAPKLPPDTLPRHAAGSAGGEMVAALRQAIGELHVIAAAVAKAPMAAVALYFQAGRSVMWPGWALPAAGAAMAAVSAPSGRLRCGKIGHRHGVNRMHLESAPPPLPACPALSFRLGRLFRLAGANLAAGLASA